MVVNIDGQRFYDEGEDVWPKRYAIWGRLVAAQPDQVGFSIIDSKSATLFMPSVFPAVMGDTLEELADKLGLPAERVRATVDEFNAACVDGRFHPTELDGLATQGLDIEKTNWARPIVDPPFYGYSLRPGVTFTYLGLKVDENAKVHSKTGEIRNLWAAGENHGWLDTWTRLSSRIWYDNRNRFWPHCRPGGSSPCQLTQSSRSDVKSRFAMHAATARAIARCFRRITRRRSFSDADITQLANLCHNCRGCYYACQFTAPHEFDLNIPKVLAELRQETWQENAVPQPLARAFHASGVAIALATIVGFALLIWAIKALGSQGGEGFYAVLSHNAMVMVFMPAFILPLIAIAVSVKRYWNSIGGGAIEFQDLMAAFAQPHACATYQAGTARAAISKMRIASAANGDGTTS